MGKPAQHSKEALLFIGPAKDSLNKQRVGPLKLAVKSAFVAVKPGLELVEARIQSRFVSDAPVLSEISDYLLSLGGKRVRPVMTLLSAKMFGQKNASSDLIDAAAGIEMIHMATLLHDDIIDESPKRRNQASAYKRFGLTPSLLAGDFLLARAFGLCSHLDDYVVSATEEACVELTEGEVLEGHLTPERELELDEYITIIAKKTASLFALSGAVGSHLAGASKEESAAMRKFGYHAGIAFQIVDDILDITADEDLLGKPSGTDLRQRTPSIINILWLTSGDGFANEYFSKTSLGEDDTQGAIEAILNTDIVSKARSLAVFHATKAAESLNSIPLARIDSDIRTKLLAIVEYTLERCM